MKEQKKEQIAFLVVLLFCLVYLIPWSYNKVIREPREATEEERETLAEKELNKFEDGNWYSTWTTPSTSVAISDEDLDVLASTSSEIYLDCTATAQVIEQEETIAYFIMPKSVDLLIKNAFRVEKDKEEVYKLIWEWQGYNYADIEGTETIILPNLYYDDLVHIRAVEDFIEWLYENDYEIVKKK